MIDQPTMPISIATSFCRHCGKHHPVSLPAYRVAMKTMANSEATAMRLQKTCIAQRQCRQNSSIHAMTIPALPTIT
jgi:hypothetical protein